MKKKAEKKKILVITHTFSTFVKRDVNILQKEYNVECHTYCGEKDMLSHIKGQVRLFFWLLRRIGSAFAVYVWFADYHAYLPVHFAKLFRKRSFVVEGGYDTVAIPEIKYGSHINALRSRMSSYAMKNTSLNLPVSDVLEQEILERIPTAKVRYLYTGYDPGFFKPAGKKETAVLTVASGNTLQRIKLKGIDVFVEAAKRLPGYRFQIVGLSEQAGNLLGEIPENIELYDKMPPAELLSYYQKAKVYAQFSMREGLPNVVCEAMLCECIPVGFPAGGIPIAIGNTGFLTEMNTVDEAVRTIDEAMKSDINIGKKAREYIITTFPQALREEKLLEYIERTDP